MSRQFKQFFVITVFFLVGAMFGALWSPALTRAQGGEAAGLEKSPPVAPGAAKIKPEDFIRYFDTMLEGQKLPPEAAGFFQGLRGIMEGAAKGQDPKILREKSGALIQGMKPYMENPDTPPEAAEMFKSFEKMTQPGTAPPQPEELMQQFEKLMQGNKIPPEAAGMFQGMRGLMQDAAKGQDPQALKERSRGLLQGAKPLMDKPDLPPEAAEMFKSFQGIMQKAPAGRPEN